MNKTLHLTAAFHRNLIHNKHCCVFFMVLHMSDLWASGGNTVVKHLPFNLKVECSSPAGTTGSNYWAENGELRCSTNLPRVKMILSTRAQGPNSQHFILFTTYKCSQ